MELFLIRHAPAEEATPEQPDSDRALTPKGRKRMERAARGLKRLDVQFDQLRHSPLLRALQTAELLVPLLQGESVADPRLTEPPGEALLADLHGERVALVGHQPWLGDLAAWLVTGDRAHGAGFALEKGGVAWLSGEPAPGRMSLIGFFPLRGLRRMGRS